MKLNLKALIVKAAKALVSKYGEQAIDKGEAIAEGAIKAGADKARKKLPKTQ
jgi:hypothetical protein